MYLKRIEVQGFKSFAHKIRFEFHNGITAIVGPNGSGKSNVADAVRWVLGEQRIKQLRGGTMQDVIFSGTESRKPLSYASVAITLDNSDHILPVGFEEVTVTRKLYRSGESEYLINGSICRLKDINEMFYDTGIGKEGYSIIGQGQIDKILSGKPDERRELFDEAAGIVKYKRRKNTSIKKLEDNRVNVSRITDILSELEKQIGPLEKQSAIAREYLKKKDDLKIYDINMFLLETARIKDQISEFEQSISNISDEIEKANQSNESMKQEYESVEDEIELTEIAIDRLRTQLNDAKMLKQQLEGKIAVLNEKINTAKINDEHYNNRNRVIEQELSTREKQLEELLSDKTTQSELLIMRRAEDQEATSLHIKIQSEIARLSERIEECNNEIRAILNNRASFQVSAQHFETTKNQVTIRVETIHQLLDEELNKQTENQIKIQEAELTLTQIREHLQGKHEEFSKNERLIELYQNNLRELQSKFNLGQTTYHREHSRLESLKNITERYDGYGNSIRNVMNRKQQEPGLIGVVADIIKVKKDYEVAIETALGGSIQNIVTDTSDTAKRMIQYLKQNKFGRCTFLPLTDISGSSSFHNKEALKEAGVVGLAHTLVDVEEQYKPLAMQLLGRTIVVDHIDHAITISRKYRQSLRIVTVDGELISPGGSMTGGSFKNSSNLLGRRREIEEFEKTVALLKKDLAEVEAEISKQKDQRASCYQANDALKQEISQISIQENTALHTLELYQEVQQKSDESQVTLQEELHALQKQIEEIESERTSLEVELETSGKMEEQLHQEIATCSASLTKKKEEETTQIKVAEEAHITCATLEQQFQFLESNIGRIQDEIQGFTFEQAELSSLHGQDEQEIKDMKSQIEEIESTIEESKELFVEIETEIANKTSQKDDLSKQHKGYLTKRDELQKHLVQLDKELFRLNSRKDAAEEASQKQIDYMWEEYELTLVRARELRDEDLNDLTYMKRQINTLKKEIKELGNVNVNAIEDYKEVSERYEFLSGQHADLMEAEQTLLSIIDELDTAMRKQFEEQFHRISIEYDKVFKELFGGGKGTLELMDEEDILEAGIKIIAQPPGKKLQNMMQLSGGEKALTAISLLFAIQNLKPSPFCLLDEIEAALDDTNVIRFSNYLHKLTKSTQFIVITHRRGTMIAADRLYGITMQEKGVSTLVSVDLIDGDIT